MSLFTKKTGGSLAALSAPLGPVPADPSDREEAALACLASFGSPGAPFTLDQWRASKQVAVHYFGGGELATAARSYARVFISMVQQGELDFAGVDDVMGVSQSRLRAAGVKRGDWMVLASLADGMKRFWLDMNEGGPLEGNSTADTVAEVLGSQLVLRLRLRRMGRSI